MSVFVTWGKRSYQKVVKQCLAQLDKHFQSGSTSDRINSRANKYGANYYDTGSKELFMWSGDGKTDETAMANVSRGKGYWVKVGCAKKI